VPRRSSPSRAQARIGLERVHQFREVIGTDQTLELKSGAVVMGPDKMCLDAADQR
jgi:hypothetical protein